MCTFSLLVNSSCASVNAVFCYYLHLKHAGNAHTHIGIDAYAHISSHPQDLFSPLTPFTNKKTPTFSSVKLNLLETWVFRAALKHMSHFSKRQQLGNQTVMSFVNDPEFIISVSSYVFCQAQQTCNYNSKVPFLFWKSFSSSVCFPQHRLNQSRQNINPEINYLKSSHMQTNADFFNHND